MNDLLLRRSVVYRHEPSALRILGNQRFRYSRSVRSCLLLAVGQYSTIHAVFVPMQIILDGQISLAYLLYDGGFVSEIRKEKVEGSLCTVIWSTTTDDTIRLN